MKDSLELITQEFAQGKITPYIAARRYLKLGDREMAQTILIISK